MLEEFRKKVKNGGNTVDFFGDIKSVQYKLSQSLKNAKDYAKDDYGWVRYKDV